MSYAGKASQNLIYNTKSSAGQVYGPVNPNSYLPQPTSTQSAGLNASYTPPMQPLTLGANTSSSSSGDSRYNQLSKTSRNPAEEAEFQRLSSMLSGAAQSGYDAELAASNSAYDYARENLLSQIPGLEGQRDRAVSDIDLGLQGVTSQVGTSKQNAQNNNAQQIRQAGSVAKTTQQQNRNVLRSLGIINSSAAGELLSKPMNEFDTQRAQLTQQLTQRVSELDDFMNQKVAEANNAKNGIIAQFTDLYGKIQSDLRFNDRQRTDAVKAASASLQQRLADIQTSLFNYQSQVDLQKQSFSQGLSQIGQYADPVANRAAIQSTSLTTPQAQQQQIRLYTDPNEQRKKQGLLSSMA